MKVTTLSILFLFSLGPESGNSDPDFDNIHIHLHDIVDNDGNGGQVYSESEGENREDRGHFIKYLIDNVLRCRRLQHKGQRNNGLCKQI